jgi:hypothetical protein
MRAYYGSLKFLFFEMDDIFCDALLPFLTLAFLDDAFQTGVRTLHDMHRVRVLPPRRGYHWKWKKEWLERPFLRQPGKGSETSEACLGYFTHLHYHQRLGRAAGFPENLKPYEIRRGVGEVVNGNFILPKFTRFILILPKRKELKGNCNRL